MYEWPTAQVEACNIGILEMVTEQVAADLQNSVQTAVYGQDERHYLLSLGDNQASQSEVPALGEGPKPRHHLLGRALG